jgi:hypothetical protein
MKRKAKILTLIPALWAALLDLSLTVHGQSIKYWQGNLNQVNEANTLVKALMKSHLLGIFIAHGIWIALIILLGYYLPHKLSRIFLLFVLLANSWGASTWIRHHGFWYVIILYLFNAILYVIIDEYEKNINKKQPIING